MTTHDAISVATVPTTPFRDASTCCCRTSSCISCGIGAGAGIIVGGGGFVLDLVSVILGLIGDGEGGGGGGGGRVVN